MQRTTAERSARRDNVTTSRTPSTPKPVYGNFQRYYHIRNPASDQAEADASTADTSIPPALVLDSRVTAILNHITCHPLGDDQAADAVVEQEAVSVLDIGCNSGKLTIQLAQTLPNLLRDAIHPTPSASPADDAQSIAQESSVEITGVDIDPSLIKQAEEAAAVARSLCRLQRSPAVRAGRSGDASQKREAAMCLPASTAFFPSVFPALFGTIPAQPHEHDTQPRDAKRQRKNASRSDTAVSTPEYDAVQDIRSSHLIPPHLDFIAAEWVDPHSAPPFPYQPCRLADLAQKDACGYTIVLALSLTKWIHIQQSDRGLTRLFARIASVLRPGGLLFLERQEWRSYHSAKHLDATMQHKTKALQMRPGGDFDYVLEAMGLVLVETIGFGRGFGFARPLQVFRKVADERAAELVEQVLGGAQFVWVARSPVSSS